MSWPSRVSHNHYEQETARIIVGELTIGDKLIYTPPHFNIARETQVSALQCFLSVAHLHLPRDLGTPSEVHGLILALNRAKLIPQTLNSNPDFIVFLYHKGDCVRRFHEKKDQSDSIKIAIDYMY